MREENVFFTVNQDFWSQVKENGFFFHELCGLTTHVFIGKFVEYDEDDDLILDVFIGRGLYQKRKFEQWPTKGLFPLPYNENHVLIQKTSGTGFLALRFHNANKFHRNFDKTFNK